MATEQTGANDTYLAQPASSSCWLGTIHEGTPRGNLQTILDDVPTYVSRPAPEKANGHIILYFPDVWGMSKNAQLLMDAFADAGFLTLGMDYFKGVRMNQRGRWHPDLIACQSDGNQAHETCAVDHGAAQACHVLTLSFPGPNVQVPTVDE